MLRPQKSSLFDFRIDYALILPVFLLSIIGFIALSISLSSDYPLKAASMLWQQAAWLLLGMSAAFFVMHLDSRTLWNLAPVLYGLGLVLMIMPIFFYSPSLLASTGAKNWLAIGGGTPLFQPSELMKVAYTLFMARIIVSYRNKIKVRYLVNDFILIGRMVLATLPVLLILIGPHMQGDLGTALVFLAIFAGMLLVSGISWKILLPLVLLFVLLIGVILYIAMSPNSQAILQSLGFKAYQSARFQSWLHPFANTQGNTYQQAQALIATSSGGVWGTGLAVSNIWVPVRESDMIFTVIGGASGFVGSAFVIFLYLYLIYRMVRATFLANSQFYIYIATGLTMMILFHVFENIGATIGVLPLTGIPLPFISQGGSNLISNVVGIGILLSIKYNKLPTFDKNKVSKQYREKLEKRREAYRKRHKIVKK